MTWFYLIRHANHDWLYKGIAGRKSGVYLNDDGIALARNLAEILRKCPIDVIYSSPLERATQTAEIIAKTINSKPPIHIAENFGEIQFGDWSGMSFTELNLDPLWSKFNTFRSGTRAPDGETGVDIQQRMISKMQELRDRFPDKNIAIVSHADSIRLALQFFLGMPVDFYSRIEIGPASVSLVEYSKDFVKVHYLNRTPEFF
jgi:broad specificity phosphatase PhoE